MVKILCDRCGKELIGLTHQITIESMVNKISGASVIFEGQQIKRAFPSCPTHEDIALSSKKSVMLLCDECNNALNNFLTQKENNND